MPVGGVVVAGSPAGDALHGHQQQHEAEQHGGELGRGDAVTEGEPGAVDAGGEGVDGEVGHGAVVRQGLHQCQGDAGGNCRPGQGQRYGEESPPGPDAEGPRGLQHTAGPLQEGGAGEEIDVGIEHEHEHQHGPGQGADVGKVVVAAPPLEEVPQGCLYRADKLQEVGIHIGHHIGRDRQGQHQRPFEDAPPGEVMHGREPGGGDTDDGHAQTDSSAQGQGVEDVFGQDGGGEVGPGAAGATEKEVETDAGNGKAGQQRHDKGGDDKRGEASGAVDESVVRS
jgi:hypothetical protein